MGNELTPSEDFIHAPYQYAILCHKAKDLRSSEITAFTFLGVPERMCSSWLESETISDLLDAYGFIDPSQDAQPVDYEYEISLKADVLPKIQQLGG